MADGKITSLSSLGTIDRAVDVFEIVDVSANTSFKATPNFILGITGTPVGTTDVQVMTNKTLTAPTISSPVFSGTITGTYTIGGTPTFPSSVATLTGIQTLTNKTLTSPTLTSPTLTNASITQDSVVGFTTANSGTVYGVPFTAATMSGANLTNSTVTASKLATGAAAAYVATLETTTSTSYADLATTTDSVTVTIGVNGLALVTLSSYIANTGNTALSFVGFAVSGATTLAANDNYALQYQAFAPNALGTYGIPFLVTGLTAGSNTFKMKYKVNGSTGTFQYRRIGVVPL